MATLTKHLHEVNVAAQACLLLSRLCTESVACTTIAASGGIQPIVKALATHTKDCVALERLAAASAGNCAAVVEAGSTASVATALMMHLASPRVARASCLALAITASHISGLSYVARAGVAAHIIEVLHKHAANASECAAACAALDAFCEFDDCSGTIVSAGAVPPTLEALKSHADSELVASSACALLVHLACEDSTVVLAAAGIPVAWLLCSGILQLNRCSVILAS